MEKSGQEEIHRLAGDIMFLVLSVNYGVHSLSHFLFGYRIPLIHPHAPITNREVFKRDNANI